MPGKTLHIIEELQQLREEFPRVSFGSPSEITFFLEKKPAEALYCYWTICPENEKKPIKKFILEWQHVHPAATGDDLIEMGVKPGPQMRLMLTELRAACLDMDLQPEQEAEFLEHYLTSEDRSLSTGS